MARTYRNPRMDRDITDLMEFGHVVAVMPDGRVIDTDERFNLLDVHAPEVVINYDGPFADAQIGKEHDADMIEYLREQGWEVLSGYSGQYLYSGPVMHQSEFIGGGLEQHIREEPGYWVKLPVEIHPSEDDPEHEDNGGNGESDYVGWIVARKIGSEDEITARTQWIAEDLAPWEVRADYQGHKPWRDEDVAMSSPVVFYKGESKDAARTALVSKLTEYAAFNHIRTAGEAPRYLSAAAEIEIENELTYSVKPSHRIMRVRAMLMPRESK